MTQHFSLKELTNSPTAEEHKINNNPSAWHLTMLRELANLLEKIRERWGKPIFINSGYRCKELNKMVGGSATSQHTKGQAADITTHSREGNKQLFLLIATLIKQNEITVGQLIDEKGYSWIHISTPHLIHNNQILHLK